MVILYHDYKRAPFSEKLEQDLNDMSPDQKLKFNVNVTNVLDFPTSCKEQKAVAVPDP
jgi:hypothetical protein